MRIAALVVLAAIIVGSGFWLARDRGSQAAPSDQAGQAAASASSTSPVATPVTGGAEEPPAAGSATTSEAEPQGEAPGADSEQPAPGGTPSDEDPAGSGEPVGSDDPVGSDEPVGSGEPASSAEPGADEALAPVSLPSGYTAVPYLVDAPVQAFDAAQAVLDDGLDYIAVLRTSRGDITVDLFEDQTPTTVNNFVFLALNRYYEGVPFHRVIDGFMAQTGDPTGTGRGGPGYAFDDEIVPDLHFDSGGVLAMANAGKDAEGNGTNGSQFFLTFEPTPWLDGAHTIFGRVTAGGELLDQITRIDPSQPSAIAFFDDTVASLKAQGVAIQAEDDETVAEAVEELLGAMPLSGQSFTLAGQSGVVGVAGGDPAFGFWPAPDELEEVVIATAPR